MRKCLLFFILSFLVFGLTSCKDKLFDFDLNNVEAEGEWGIPVFNDKITVENLLNNLDSVSFLHIGSDGTISFVVEKDMSNLVSMDKLLHFGDKSFSQSGSMSLNLNKSLDVHLSEICKFSLNDDNMFLKRVVVNTGFINLMLSFSDLPAAYYGTAYTDNIKDANGNPLTINVNSAATSQNFDLAGYVIQGDEEGNIIFSVDLTITPDLESTLGGNYHYTCIVDVSSLEVQSVVTLLNPIATTIIKNVGVNFSLKDFHIDDMQIYNPKIQILAQNSLCAISGNVNEFSFTDAHGTTSPLISSPITVTIPVSPYAYVQVVDINTPQVQFNTTYDSLRLVGNLTVNPGGFAAGDLYLNNNSSLNLQLKATFPANMSIHNAVYSKELDNALFNAITPSQVSDIEKMTLRLAFANNLPFEMVADISFLNTTTSDTTHLLMCENTIHGSFNGQLYQETPIFVDVNGQTAKKIIESDKLLLRFKINTQGNAVELNTSRFIKVAVGAKIKYNHINMDF